MAPRLQVTIGSDRFHEEIAWVNHTSRPTEIDTPNFTGRILVLVKDFAGVTPDGSPPKRDAQYFEGRTRRFGILIEGKWKRQAGVQPYSGEEVQFGSDFEYLPESFPSGPFNLGMRIAQRIDPATYYEFHPPHGRPYIMSPYIACMNTFCAYPAPDAFSRAVVLSRDEPEKDATQTFVPTEQKDGKKWVEQQHWSFLGLRGDARVDAFLAEHTHLLPAQPTVGTAANAKSSLAPPERPGLTQRQSSLILGTSDRNDPKLQRSGSPEADMMAIATAEGNGVQTNNGLDARTAALKTSNASSVAGSGTATPTSSSATDTPKKKKSGSRFSLSSLVHALDTSSSSSSSNSSSTANNDHLVAPHLLANANEPGGRGRAQSVSAQYKPSATVQKELGPWRFADEEVDATEDTNFVFLDPDHPRTVPQRRKHFCSENGKHRKEFTYDPDCIYTASFFTPFCDLNTLDLKMGPISINVAPYFTKMPIRYTLRSTRMAPRPDGNAGPLEEEVFATIGFRLVDEA